MKRILHIIRLIIQSLFFTSALLLIVMHFNGLRFFIVTTGSMEPTIPVGSVCLVNQHIEFEKIKPGDIIAFRMNSAFVTHRAIAVTQEGITTKGDANHSPDTNPVRTDNYTGRVVLHLPWIGYGIVFLRSRAGIILAAAAVIIIFLLSFMPQNSGRSDSETETEPKDTP